MKRFLFLFASLLTVTGAFAAGMSDEVTNMLLAGGLLMLVVCIEIALLVWIARMAKRSQRNVVLWVLLGLLINPILIAILLWLLGEKPRVERGEPRVGSAESRDERRRMSEADRWEQ